MIGDLDPFKHNKKILELITLVEYAYLYEGSTPSTKDKLEAYQALMVAQDKISRYAMGMVLGDNFTIPQEED